MKLEPLVHINISKLIDVCGLNKKDKDFLFNDFRQENRKNIHEVFRYQKLDDDFTDYITLYSNGKFSPCYDEFLDKLVKNLNVKNANIRNDNDELTKILLERIEYLKNLPDEAELHNEFPVLYKDLQNGREFMNEIETERKEKPSYKEKTDEDEHYYYSCGLRKDLYGFIQNQVKLYTRMVLDRKKYKELIHKTKYNDYLKEQFDMDKVTLFIMNSYLEFCEKNSDRKVILKYFKEINKYIKSNSEKNISIYIGNKIVNFNTIVDRVQNIEKKLNYVNGQAEWEFIPEGKLDYVKGVGVPKKESMSLEKLEKLRKKGKEKTDFFMNSPYSLKVYGKMKYKGYVAYIYPNGKVVLDTLYNDNYPSTAEGNAIYIVDASVFEIVTRLDKQDLKIHPLVTKINHTDTWRERTQKFIEEEGKEEDKKVANELIKKFKKTA